VQEVLINVNSLVKHFDVVERGIIGRKKVGEVHAIDSVSFNIHRGETLGLVGESGLARRQLARYCCILKNPHRAQ